MRPLTNSQDFVDDLIASTGLDQVLPEVKPTVMPEDAIIDQDVISYNKDAVADRIIDSEIEDAFANRAIASSGEDAGLTVPRRTALQSVRSIGLIMMGFVATFIVVSYLVHSGVIDITRL
jgi:hypothetical protein